MKVLIHALGASMGGALRHLTNFLPELGRQDSHREYVVMVRESLPQISVQENIRVERISDDQASGWITRMIGDVVELPRRLKREHFSGVVSLTNLGPIWSPIPHILFQRNALYYCKYYFSKVRERKKIETMLRRRLAVESMKRADLIVTPSDAMARMIKETCPEIHGRAFRTLYHGFTAESLHDPLDVKYERLLARDGIRLLYPTHAAVHKGFEVLFKALEILKNSRPDFTLFTTISHDDWPEGMRQYERQVESLGLKENVVFMGRVPQRQMGALYDRCHLMVYPSLCESFGFSMIEAMGYGLPIVAADTAVNREICSEGAFYYSPLDPAAAAAAMSKGLHSDVMNKLSEHGRRRALSFDWGWKRYAGEFAQLLEEVGC